MVLNRGVLYIDVGSLSFEYSEINLDVGVENWCLGQRLMPDHEVRTSHTTTPCFSISLPYL